MKTDREMFVQVSPWVTRAWFDPASRIWFKPGELKFIPKGTELKNITRYLIENLIIERTPNKVISEVPPEDIEVSTPGQLLAEPEQEVEETIEVEFEPDEALVAMVDGEVVLELEPITVTSPPKIPDPITVTEEETVEVTVESNKVACQYCGKEYSPRGIKAHERACKENPEA